MQQIIIIHGGESFTKHEDYISFLENHPLDIRPEKAISWRSEIQSRLPEYHVLKPNMPCKQNAKYTEWEIWFKKILPQLEKDCIFI